VSHIYWRRIQDQEAPQALDIKHGHVHDLCML